MNQDTTRLVPPTFAGSQSAALGAIDPIAPIRPSSIVVWISILAGPVCWAICLESRYALVQWTCVHHCGWVLNVIGGTAFVACIAAALLGWAAFKRFDRDAHRERFMAISGLILSSSFALVVTANTIPTFFLSPCS
jgi:anaerobic C4-dicarboxylate transporter